MRNCMHISHVILQWINQQVTFSCFLHPAFLFSGSSVHWQRENKPPAEHYPIFYSRAPSAEIEMTSYVLLALLNKAELTPDDLSYISCIVYWLVKQQNPYGGFSSSQVTNGCGKKNRFWEQSSLQAGSQKYHVSSSHICLNNIWQMVLI